MLWAVSQAAPLRRVHVNQNLMLSEAGYSSGGFLADALIGGNIFAGSQQQWFTRNAKLAGDKAKIGGGDTTLSESLQFSTG